jgi:Domain of unknown function (DUF4440)
MSQNIVIQIEAAEDRLRHAMLTSDVAVLDALISKDLIFTTHHGAVMSKQDDLAHHRSGLLTFHKIELSEQKVMPITSGVSSAAFVSVRAEVSGVFADTPFEDDIRFSRVWQLTPSHDWQVIAGQATALKSHW